MTSSPAPSHSVGKCFPTPQAAQDDPPKAQDDPKIAPKGPQEITKDAQRGTFCLCSLGSPQLMPFEPKRRTGLGLLGPNPSPSWAFLGVTLGFFGPPTQPKIAPEQSQDDHKKNFLVAFCTRSCLHFNSKTHGLSATQAQHPTSTNYKQKT